MKQLCGAINYIHNEKNTIHRDIKPANILFKDSSRSVLKLGDFGLAKVFAVEGYN